MGWERRARGGWYYTRSKRKNGRVVREYFGCGGTAQLLAMLDEADREERSVERAEREQERAVPLATEEALSALGAELDGLVRATLIAAGYHEHRGQWRRSRSDGANTDRSPDA